MKDKRKQLIGAALLMLILLLIDQWTKLLAVDCLKGQNSFPLIRGVLEFQYLENHGAAFGILQGQKLFLVLFTAILSALILYFYFRIPAGSRYRPLRILMIMLLSGAIGNFIDRMVNGYVVDFFYFKLINFPVFNVADIYVTAAEILLIVLVLFYYQSEDFEEIFHGKK